MDPIDRAMVTAQQQLECARTDETLAADIAVGLTEEFGNAGMRFARPLRAGLDAPVCPRCGRRDGWFQWADTAELSCVCDAASWPAWSGNGVLEAPHPANPEVLLERSQRCLAQMAEWQAAGRARIRRTRDQLRMSTQCLASSRQLLAHGSHRVCRAPRL
jgi:hypothetical protein